MLRSFMTFAGCVAMVAGCLVTDTSTHASQQDECVSVQAVGTGFYRKIVVSTTCNRPTKQVQIYCGVPGGYVTGRLVRAWPGRPAEMPCDGRGSAQWCYLIEPASGERCL